MSMWRPILLVLILSASLATSSIHAQGVPRSSKGEAAHRAANTPRVLVLIGDSSTARWISSAEWNPLHLTILSHPASLTLPVDADLVWIHAESEEEYRALLPAARALAQGSMAKGGQARSWLCTGVAALFPSDMGWEPVRPTIRREVIQAGVDDARGVQSWMGHPAFTPLFGGGRLLLLDTLRPMTTVGYWQDNLNPVGRVFAVEMRETGIRSDQRCGLEYNRQGQRILTLGCPIHLHPRNHVLASLLAVLRASMAYLLDPSSGGPSTAWPIRSPRVLRVSTRFTGLPLGGGRLTPCARMPYPSSGRDSAGSGPLLLSSPVGALLTRERGGIRELWLEGVRVLKDLRIGWMEGDRIVWMDEVEASVSQSPDRIERRILHPGGVIHEVLHLDPTRSRVLLSWTREEGPLPSLIFRWIVDLRRMWPYDENAGGDLSWSIDDVARIHTVECETGFGMAVLTDAPVRTDLAGRYDSVIFAEGSLHGRPVGAHHTMHALVTDSSRGEGRSMLLVIAGSPQGKEESVARALEGLRDPCGGSERLRVHTDSLLSRVAVVQGSDSWFNDGMLWSLLAFDRSCVHLAGGGKGMISGWGDSGSGWDGGQATSGRPSQGWVFGSDVLAAVDAAIAIGRFEDGREYLETLFSHSSPEGWIPEEITGSGVHRMGGVDLLERMVLACDEYVRASGDEAFLRRHEGALQTLLHRLEEQWDEENGVRWSGEYHEVNLGPLKHVTQECGRVVQRIRAATAVASVFSAFEDPRQVRKWKQKAETLRDQFERRYWSASTGWYIAGFDRDGVPHLERTARALEPLYGNLAHPAFAARILEGMRSSDFLTDWGLRLYPRSSAREHTPDVQDYAVWPFLTARLAEVAWKQGFSLDAGIALQAMLAARHRAGLGALPQALRGDICAPVPGVEASLLSEAAFLDAIIGGMVGWEPDARISHAFLRPRFPWNWQQATVRHLRVGETRVHLDMLRTRNRTRWTLRRNTGPPVTLSFQPEIAEGMQITSIFINGRSLATHHRGGLGVLTPALELELRDSVVITIHHTGGIGWIPPDAVVMDGDSSQGLRLLSTRTLGDGIEVEVEGRADSTYGLEGMLFDQEVVRAEGASVVAASRNGRVRCAVTLPPSRERWVRTKMRLQVRPAPSE